MNYCVNMIVFVSMIKSERERERATIEDTGSLVNTIISMISIMILIKAEFILKYKKVNLNINLIRSDELKWQQNKK